ncbi:MAG: toprim domain-containing protein, partial [Cyanobium sp. 49614_E6]|nr:toprim domain-containing protein [Cyanobium sp. 49614_E6]
IPIPEQDPEAAARAEAEHQERQRLRQWRSQQEEEFHHALLSDLQASCPASLYLQQRGISADTAISWRLGLNASRLMLPIRDGQGRCCGFSGRSLNGEEPKYRNSSADLLFQKSQLLLGLDQAAAGILSTGEALLVEGPLDVIQLHQAGFTTAVAAMGTVLTLEQLQLLQRRGARRLLVVFDGDGAGRSATGKLIAGLRSAVIATGLELAVVELPSGTDPDGLIRSHGPDALRRTIEQARHWLQWELDQLLAPLNADAEGAAGRFATRGPARAGGTQAPGGPGGGAPAAPWGPAPPGQGLRHWAAPGAPTSAQLSGITTTRPRRRCADRAGRIPGPAPVPLQPRLPRSPGGARRPQ